MSTVFCTDFEKVKHEVASNPSSQHHASHQQRHYADFSSQRIEEVAYDSRSLPIYSKISTCARSHSKSFAALYKHRTCSIRESSGFQCPFTRNQRPPGGNLISELGLGLEPFDSGSFTVLTDGALPFLGACCSFC